MFGHMGASLFRCKSIGCVVQQLDEQQLVTQQQQQQQYEFVYEVDVSLVNDS